MNFDDIDFVEYFNSQDTIIVFNNHMKVYIPTKKTRRLFLDNKNSTATISFANQKAMLEIEKVLTFSNTPFQMDYNMETNYYELCFNLNDISDIIFYHKDVKNR